MKSHKTFTRRGDKNNKIENNIDKNQDIRSHESCRLLSHFNWRKQSRPWRHSVSNHNASWFRWINGVCIYILARLKHQHGHGRSAKPNASTTRKKGFVPEHNAVDSYAIKDIFPTMPVIVWRGAAIYGSLHSNDFVNLRELATCSKRSYCC